MAFVRLMVSELLFLGKGQTFILSLLDLSASIDPRTSGQQFAPGLGGFTLTGLSFVEKYIQNYKFTRLNCELLQEYILFVSFSQSNTVWKINS